MSTLCLYALQILGKRGHDSHSVTIYFHFGCGCSRTRIYLSAKRSCCTVSFQGFKAVLLLWVSSLHCGRADAPGLGGEKPHTQRRQGRTAEMAPNGFPGIPTGSANFVSPKLLEQKPDGLSAWDSEWGSCRSYLLWVLAGYSQGCIHCRKWGPFLNSHKDTRLGHLDVA